MTYRIATMSMTSTAKLSKYDFLVQLCDVYSARLTKCVSRGSSL